MRRDYFTLQLEDTAWAEDSGDPLKPVIAIDFDGPSEFESRVRNATGAPLAAEELDVAYRLTGPAGEEDTTGVLSLTNRLTGEFILEVNASPQTMDRLVSAARTYEQETDDDGRYRIRLTDHGEGVFFHDKRTLLVYDSEGGLLRQRSLIPSGVEL